MNNIFESSSKYPDKEHFYLAKDDSESSLNTQKSALNYQNPLFNKKKKTIKSHMNLKSQLTLYTHEP